MSHCREKFENTLIEIPEITYNDIRRLREPFFVALMKEQLEDGFFQTAQLMEKFHSEMRDLSSTEIHNELSRNLLLNLVDLLRRLEAGRNANMANSQHQIVIVKEILVIGKRLLLFGQSFFGISREIFLVGLSEMQGLPLKDYELVANLQYSLGHLHKQFNNYVESCEYFYKAKNLAKNKQYTTISLEDTIGMSKSQNLYHRICIEYTAAILGAANLQTDPTKMRQFISEAIDIAKESADENSKGDANMAMGRFLHERRHFDQSRDEFRESYKCFRKSKNIKGQCEAHLALARSLLCLEKNEECIAHIKTTIELARESNNLLVLAVAQNELADIFDASDRLYEAAENYNASVELYSQLGMTLEMTEARCLAANCLAKVLVKDIAGLRLKMDTVDFGDNVYMEKLAKWKCDREIFWDTSAENDDIGHELAQAITKIRGANLDVFK